MLEVIEVEKRIEFPGFYHRVLLSVTLIDGEIVAVEVSEHYRVIVL